MDILHIAHDLAIAKLNGSNLSEVEMYDTYLQYYESFLQAIKSKSSKPPEVKVFQRPF